MSTFNDPVCGMMVRAGEGLASTYQGQEYRFCSEFCQRAFQADPGRYLGKSAQAATLALNALRHIAYFSMEVAVDSRMPTYSGGLGVLAGDTLRSMADLRIPAVAVTLLYRNGYFEQHLDEWGNQSETAAVWDPSSFAHPLAEKVTVTIENRPVTIRVWQYDIEGITSHTIPLFLLDTNCDENEPADRELTSWLYGGDERYRFAQEIILGMGGLRMLWALGYTGLERFHMNEGHAALLVLELLRETRVEPSQDWDFESARRRCIFTTHTPVAAGHDQFSYDLIKRVLGEPIPLDVIQMLGGKDRFNMTLLALNTSHYVNGVAKRHGVVSRVMFADYPIDSITNGVHSATWTCESFGQLYDTHIPGWANDPFSLRYAISIPKGEIRGAHTRAKSKLVDEVRRRTGLPFRDDVLTLGFARRATPYKRADLLFHDPGQLLEIAESTGPMQVLFAGKAHPRDQSGKDLIRKVVEMARQLKEQITIAYLENYDMALAQLLTAGVDVWLNTPMRPLEASGTSGMKAAHNGVPSLSVLDGWWIEGHIEGVTGWSIGPRPSDATLAEDASRREDAEDLYRKLRAEIVPMFYGNRERWMDIMRQSIAFNASFFNTHRMVQQYAANAYV